MIGSVETYTHDETGRCAYMGYFGTDENAEHVIEALGNEGAETVKCRHIYELDRFDMEYLAFMPSG